MIDYELEHGDPRAAAALCSELDAPPPALAERVREAVRGKEAREAELLQLERAHDVKLGTRTRTFLSALLGVMFTSLPLAGAFHPAWRPSSAAAIAFWSGMFLAVVLGLGVWARHSMMRTLFNRRVFAFVVACFVLQLALALGASIADLQPPLLEVVLIFEWLVLAATSTIAIDRRLFPTAIGYFAAFLVAARWASAVPFAEAGSNFVLMVNAIFIWRPEKWQMSAEEREWLDRQRKRRDRT
jgi:hypothetical protein